MDVTFILTFVLNPTFTHRIRVLYCIDNLMIIVFLSTCSDC